MKKLLLLSLLGLCAPLAARAEDAEPRNLRRDTNPNVSSQGVLSPTPEMWFYEQERTRYEDSKSAVRRKAEYRSAARAERTAALKWYGMSNSRPTASPTPFTGTYSPTWVSGNRNPDAWSMGPGTTVVVRPRLQY
jgi:hypothetical protein